MLVSTACFVLLVNLHFAQLLSMFIHALWLQNPSCLSYIYVVTTFASLSVSSPHFTFSLEYVVDSYSWFNPKTIQFIMYRCNGRMHRHRWKTASISIGLFWSQRRCTRNNLQAWLQQIKLHLTIYFEVWKKGSIRILNCFVYWWATIGHSAIYSYHSYTD